MISDNSGTSIRGTRGQVSANKNTSSNKAKDGANNEGVSGRGNRGK